MNSLLLHHSLAALGTREARKQRHGEPVSLSRTCSLTSTDIGTIGAGGN